MITVIVPTDWTAIVTAIATVAVAIVAVGIAIWSDRQIGRRVEAEQSRGDKSPPRSALLPTAAQRDSETA